MQRGIFFRAETNELLIIAGNGDELPGSGWRLLTDDANLGLLSIRALLVEQGLANESTVSDACWYMQPRKQDDAGPQRVEPPKASLHVWARLPQGERLWPHRLAEPLVAA